jgi:signal transduction histidine kinase
LVIIGFLNFKIIQQDIKNKLISESSIIADNFGEPLLYIEGFARVISDRISVLDDTSPKNIAKILKNSTIPSADSHDVFTWTLFDFVNAERKVVASSIHGVLPNPKKIPINKRSWIKKAYNDPGKLFLSAPDIGITSGEWIIPAGLGVTNKNNEFVGIVSLGISIKKIATRLKDKSNSYVNFLILDKNGYILIDSRELLVSEKPKKIDKIDLNTNFKDDFTNTDIEYKSDEYTYLRRIPKYDFYVAIGQNKAAARQLFNEKVLPQVFQTAAMGIFTLMLLFFFKYRLVSPITQLSKAADSLMQGGTNISAPRGGPIEIHILSKQLVNLRRYIKRIQRIDKKLFKAKQEAERANKAKSDFLANMSHELRTPLNAIIGYSEIIKSQMFGKVGNDKYIEYSSDIHSSGIHLLNLINDILDISKAEAGKFEILEENVDICEAARESLKLISEQAAQKKIPVKTNLPEEEIFIYADKLRIKQIMINILSNAVKFSDSGQEIRFEIKEDEGLIITVKDNGIGISQTDIPKILEKFGHIKNSMVRQSEGTGLGLWLTKMLIEAHNGTLHIDSKVGFGTTVTVYFPESLIIRN